MSLFSLSPKKRVVSEHISNPAFFEQSAVIPDKDERGNVCNKVVMQPVSHRSPFEGVHFVESEMSLRAKLNLGSKFTYVSNVNIDNDPAVVLRKMMAVENAVNHRLEQLSQSITPESPVTSEPIDEISVTSEPINEPS